MGTGEGNDQVQRIRPCDRCLLQEFHSDDQSCSRMGLHVIAMSPKRYCTGFYSRHTRERHVCPDPVHHSDECLDFLVKFVQRRPVSVLIPLGHFMTDFIARHQEALRCHTRLVAPPYSIFVQGLNKCMTLKAAARVGCPMPRTWFPQDQPLAQDRG